MPSIAVATNQLVAKVLKNQNLLPPEVLERLSCTPGLNRNGSGKWPLMTVSCPMKSWPLHWHARCRLPMVNLLACTPETRALECLSESECRKYAVIPLVMQRGMLVLAMANPLDEASKEQLKQTIQCEMSIQVAPLNAILKTVEIWYAKLAALADEGSPDLRQMLSDLRLSDESTPSRLGGTSRGVQTDLENLLVMMTERLASDLHLAAGSPPLLRVDGELQQMPFAVLTPQTIQTIVYSILTDVQITTFERGSGAGLFLQLAGGLAFSREYSPPARLNRRGIPHYSDGRAQPGEVENAAGRARIHAQAARVGAGHRSDRGREIHHPGGDGRGDQPDDAQAYRHHRRSDRVPAQ